ncbi:MAG: DUF4156 domain-containing protein [Enterobacteriaceae bacterium]
MKVKGLMGLSLILLIAGCSTTNQLTTGGAEIKFVTEKPGAECRYIGDITGAQSTWFSGNASDASSMRGAANDLRNKAAAMGGNTIYGADSTQVSFWSSFVPLDSKMVGQVYHCGN